MKVYVLLLYLCCQPNAKQVRFDSLQSPEDAAVIFWQKNHSGSCYEGRLLEYDLTRPGDPRIHSVEIPKVTFTK